MDKYRFTWADVVTFGAIALVAAFFAQANTGIAAVNILSHLVCAVALLLTLLAATVNHPRSH